MATQCILTTGNIMSAGAEVIRKPSMEKSNTELVNSLRENFRAAAATSAPPSPAFNESTNAERDHRKPVNEWTNTSEDGVLYIPSIWEDATGSGGLCEEREEYDITVKLFHLPSAPTSCRPAHTREAIRLVCKELGTDRLDLLITSFPSVSFDADDNIPSSDAEVAEWVESYRTLEALHESKVIARLGISEFGTTRLSQLLQHTLIKPSVDQINVRDCCVVPKPLILYAKEKGIELLTHNDCTDILPPETLNMVVNDEFGVLGESRKLHPQWVIKYTAVIRSRGVVENKGYIAMAVIQAT
ncbi:hypothetical protein EDC01DRAFT_717597 [Geopyxis carbonaria]|nr:hypothetical protein EDC01DRAFT_717597 [Geopyxis carbonaria]